MPLVNYCKKCKTEVPLGETCPYCSGKLTQTGEMISFGLMRRVVKDWFAWNNLLRIVLPVLALVCIIVVAAEAWAGGWDAVAALLAHGFMETMLGLLALVLLGIWLVLRLQGIENVHVVLDKQGVHVRTYVQRGDARALMTRFVGEQTVERLEASDERAPLNGLALVRRVTLPWSEIRRVRIWREGSTMLFFRPAFWQVAAVHVPVSEMNDAEALVRKKLKRMKKVRVLPQEKKEKKKKR